MSDSEMAENDSVTSSKPPARPTIALPPRVPIEALFASGGFGASPGPMTLVSNFFSDTDLESEYRSFSQLLAGTMASPAAASASEVTPAASDLRFKQNRPAGLAVTQPQVFTIPPGLSPATLLGSPGLFPGQGPFGMSHQQALAHVTAQAQSNIYMQDSLPTSLATIQEPKEEPQIQKSYGRPYSSSITVGKPAEDGYNWRKYGQKAVKGSEFPRSYYKCTHPSCPVKKKVERSHDGQVTEIIYKGQHNHPPPQTNKRGKDAGNQSGSLSLQSINNSVAEEQGFSLGRKDPESSQATGECLSSSEEVGDEGATTQGVEDEPDAKRRNLEVGVTEQTASHRTVTEPKIVVQTRSEVDLLDDGFRWREYGQKVVKGNPYPRSYYKCTYQGCNVRKHIERASTDPKAVITTYEGKHNHDIPAPRASSHYTNNMPQPPPRPPNVANQCVFPGKPSSSDNNHQPVAFLQLKEEKLQ